MNLRVKTLAIIGTTLVGLLLVHLVASRLIVLNGFEDVETSQALDHVTRVEAAIEQDVRTLENTTGDWSYWDDTFEFVQGEYPEYVETNLEDGALGVLGVNFMLFVDAEGGVYHAQAIDLDSGEDVELDDASVAAVLAHESLTGYTNDEEGDSGLVSVAGMPTLVAARPITDSSGEGEVAGTLVMGRTLTYSAIANLSTRTRLDVSVVSLDAPGASVVPVGATELTKSGSDALVAMTTLTDVDGAPVATIDVSIPRDVYNKGVSTVWYLTATLIISGLVFIAMMAVLIQRLVVSRLSKLNENLDRITDGGDLSARVEESGQDEVSRLARSINLMLASIAEAAAAQRESEERFRHLAHHDPLTQLPNRTLFLDRAGIALAQAQRTSQRVALISLDMDRLKTVNDTLGHPTGDDLLKSTAVRLAGLVRSADTVARVGGDEFLVLIPMLDGAEDGFRTAARLVEAMGRPFLVNGHEMHTTVSAGVSFYPDDAGDLETLIKNADAAMYRAKQHGRNNYQVYTPAMNDRASERMQTELSLRRAIDRGELSLRYQPQVSITTGEIEGVEALLRWEHPQRGEMMPDAFIPIAEESGMIVPIGEWVVHEVCRQAKEWSEQGVTNVRFAMNISVRQFQQHDFAEMVTSALHESGVEPSLIDLEITESTIVDDANVARTVLERLSATGVRIAIDDFGTGYSSLQHLREFPIDVVKLDRSFVSGLPEDANDAAISIAVITLAHGLQVEVIAEGVETQEQLEFLRTHGCDSYQGYVFSRPVRAADALALIKSARAHAGTSATLPADQP